MKISTRLSLGFATMLALVALLGAISMSDLITLRREIETVMQDQYPKLKAANEMKALGSDASQALRTLFIVSDPRDIKAQHDIIADSAGRTNDDIERLTRTIHGEAGKVALARLVKARDELREQSDKVVALSVAGRSDEAKNMLLLDLRLKQMAYTGRIEDLIKLEDALMIAAGASVANTVDTSKLTLASLLGVSFLLAIGLAIWTVRSTTRPIREAAAIARTVASGDLTMEFKSDGKNETGLLLGALHDMKTHLSAIVGHARSNAQGVAAASAQIAQGNIDLSSRTEQQAAALQETAASMEELSATVRQNAENARQANQLAVGASSVAVQGGEVVGQVVETMKDISASSRKIVDIISVINGIALQTNILALNAAVEAARAGAQGRGFAVVATEVRSLAQRSAEAAREIKGLICASVESVERGTALVSTAGETMREVVSSIRRVTDIVGEISAASTEQSAGVAQVGEALTQMDQATQQNAALVEESAAAAESLRTQAFELVQAVAVFKISAEMTALKSESGSESGRSTFPSRSVAVATGVGTVADAGQLRIVERRGPNRARNVVRPRFGTAPRAAADTPQVAVLPKTAAGEWESF